MSVILGDFFFFFKYGEKITNIPTIVTLEERKDNTHMKNPEKKQSLGFKDGRVKTEKELAINIEKLLTPGSFKN